MTEAWQLKEKLRNVPDTQVLEDVIDAYLLSLHSSTYGMNRDISKAKQRRHAAMVFIDELMAAFGCS